MIVSPNFTYYLIWIWFEISFDFFLIIIFLKILFMREDEFFFLSVNGLGFSRIVKMAKAIMSNNNLFKLTIAFLSNFLLVT